jgi:integrase
MFKYAVEWGYLAVNPFAGTKLLRVGRRNRKNWHYVKPKEYMALLKAAPTLQWKVFYALAYTSGARFGELFSLTEENVDFERGKLVIRSREGSDTLPPFSVKDHEDREIPLPRHTLKLVAGWVKVRPKGSPLILLAPKRYTRVLRRWHECRTTGEPWMNDYMTNNTVREIRRHAKWAKLKLDGALTTHCFRKSCGQNWANHLPMNVVKELMGHADISTTEEFYSKVSDDHEAKAQWVIEAITVGQAKTSDAQVTPGPQIKPIRKVG